MDHQWLHLLLLAHGVEAEVKKKDLRKRSFQARRPVFKKTVPMSNFDLLEWCQYLEIPIISVLSRDETIPHNNKLSLFIYNLEPSYFNDRVINYFDSFGTPPFQEIVNHAKEWNLTLLHQNRQIQNLYTSTCGYFCLYFLMKCIKMLIILTYYKYLVLIQWKMSCLLRNISKIKYKMENFKEKLRSFLDPL